MEVFSNNIIFIIAALIQLMCSILGRILYVKCETEQEKVLGYATVGYNTDYYGFGMTLDKFNIKIKD